MGFEKIIIFGMLVIMVLSIVWFAKLIYEPHPPIVTLQLAYPNASPGCIAVERSSPVLNFIPDQLQFKTVSDCKRFLQILEVEEK